MQQEIKDKLRLKVIDVGVSRYYQAQKIESNFHKNFKDLNLQFREQRRERAHAMAERCLAKFREKMKQKVESQYNNKL